MKRLYKQTKRLLVFMLAFFSFGYASAQIEVSGILTDESTGDALIGASIAEVGTTNGTFTDYDGSWSLTVSGPQAQLEFSYMGYATKTKTVGSSRTFNIKLAQEVVMVNTVVKTGYMSQKKEDVTGGIAQIKGSEIADKPVLGVDQALQGKAAGVQVRSNSGTPGGSMDIVIRGRGTLGDARPLYVVDGVPVGNEYKGDPSNIENISILKDASSCAMYGARGANGVVLITTRGGNEVGTGVPTTTISFDAYRGVQSAWKKIETVTGEEYANIRNAESIAAGQDSVYVYGAVDTVKKQISMDSITNTDWQDAVFRKAVIQKYKLRVEGNSEYSSWSASAGYLQQEGIVNGTNYERYDIGYKAMYKLTDKLDFGISSGFNLTSQDVVNEGKIKYSVLGRGLLTEPTIPVYDATGNWAAPETGDNPVGKIANELDNTSGFGVGVNLWAAYKIAKGLDFRTTYNYGFWQKTQEEFRPKYYIKPTQKNDHPYLYHTVQGGNGWSTSNTLVYSYGIKDNLDTNKIAHSFKFLAGQEALYEFQETNHYEIDDVNESPTQRYFATGTGDSKVVIQDWQLPNEHSMMSYFGRVEYVYKDKYPVNFTFRRDGSSRFGSGMKYGNFPSVGAAWKINKERFFVMMDTANPIRKYVGEFKLRAGWGKIGNESIKNYAYVGSITNSADARYNFGGNHVSGMIPATFPNPDLHWEEATSWSYGLDMSAFKNKIIFNADYFIKKNVDNLIQVAVPAIMGVSDPQFNPYTNAGEITNKGYELSLTYQDQYQTDSMKNPIKYAISGNFTRIKNEVIFMDNSTIKGGYIEFGSGGPGIPVSSTEAGYPIAYFYGYKIDGILQNWSEVNQSAQATAKPGDYKIVDVNGDGLITPSDMTKIGSPTPDFTYGLNASVGYLGFDLGLSFQGVEGNDIFNSTKMFLDGGIQYSNRSTRRLDVWSPENTGSSESPNAAWYDGSMVFPSSLFIEDGSYLRLKNITLGYTVPEKIANKMKLNKLRVYGQIQNAITWTKYSGFDPEIGTNEDLNYQGPEFGVDRGAYPQARTILFGLNLEF